MNVFLVFKRFYLKNLGRRAYRDKEISNIDLLLKNSTLASRHYVESFDRGDLNLKLKCSATSHLSKYYFNVSERARIFLKQETVRKKDIVFLKAVRKFDRNLIASVGAVLKLPLPTRYSNLSMVLRFLRYLKGTSKRLVKTHDISLCDILVLPEHFVHEEIWGEIAGHLHKTDVQVVRLDKWVSGYGVPRSGLRKKLEKDLRPFRKIFNAAMYFDFKRSIMSIARLLEFSRPKIVVSFCEHNHYAGALSYLGDVLGFSVINIAHAISSGYHRMDSPFNYHIVFGESSVNYLRSMGGVVCGDIVPLGSPRMDKVFNSGGYSSGVAASKGGDVLFLSDTVWGLGLELKMDYVNDILRLAAEFPRVNFRIKKHTSENDAIWETAGKGYENISIYRKDFSLASLLKDSKIAINIGWSASSLEVAASRVPLINMNYNNCPDILNVAKSSFARVVRKYSELEKEFRCLMNESIGEQDYVTFLEYHCSNLGGSANEIAKFVIDRFTESRNI